MIIYVYMRLQSSPGFSNLKWLSKDFLETGLPPFQISQHWMQTLLKLSDNGLSIDKLSQIVPGYCQRIYKDIYLNLYLSST